MMLDASWCTIGQRQTDEAAEPASTASLQVDPNVSYPRGRKAGSLDVSSDHR
jgi:hypothetical protein